MTIPCLIFFWIEKKQRQHKKKHSINKKRKSRSCRNLPTLQNIKKASKNRRIISQFIYSVEDK